MTQSEKVALLRLLNGTVYEKWPPMKKGKKGLKPAKKGGYFGKPKAPSVTPGK